MSDSRTAEIVQLAPNVKAFAVALDQLDSYQGVKLVAKLMRQWERSQKENTFKLLAARATLTPTTVQRLASETTKSPRLHTVLMIMKALGFVAVRFE